MHMALPMFAYMVYIVFLGLFNFRTRKKAILEKHVKMSYMRDFQGEAPAHLIVSARHFDNQFQIPMLFLITCLSTYVFISNNPVSFILAWVFIFSRMVHSYVHLGSNNVIHRAQAYFVGVIVCLLMWLNIIYNLFL